MRKLSYVGEGTSITVRWGIDTRWISQPVTNRPPASRHGRQGVTDRRGPREKMAIRSAGEPGPSRWVFVSALSLVPLFVGRLDGLASLNEWQVMAAVILGGVIGAAFLSITWLAALSGHPLLDTFGRRGRWPLLALWGVWAGAVGLVTTSWAGAVLSTVVSWPASLSVALLALVAALLAGACARGVRVPILVVAGLTAVAAILVTPHIISSALPGVWQGSDKLLGGDVRVGNNPYPFSVEWPTFWARLVDIAGLSTATVMLWAPMWVPTASGAPSVRDQRWMVAQSVVVASVVCALIYVGTATRFGVGLPVTNTVNPAVQLMALRGPGVWRDALAVAVSGGAVLWLGIVWAGGPPVHGVSVGGRRAVTGMAALVGVFGAIWLTPGNILTILSTPSQLHADAAHVQITLDVLGGSYLLAPLIGIAGVQTLFPTWVGRRRLLHAQLFPHGVWAMLAWVIGVAASVHWLHGFGWLSFGPWAHRWIPSLPAHATAFAPVSGTADWAIAVSTLVGSAVYGVAQWIHYTRHRSS